MSIQELSKSDLNIPLYTSASGQRTSSIALAAKTYISILFTSSTSPKIDDPNRLVLVWNALIHRSISGIDVRSGIN